MKQALELAERGLYTTTPNPRVGCVIARDGHMVGEGWHRRAGEPHAEVLALADTKARGNDARGATVYVTLEPCNHHGRTPPSVDAMLAAGVARVVAAMPDPNPAAGGGADRLRAAGVVFESGLLEKEARELNPGFISRMTHGTPWVRVKIAASLDGKTALLSGESQWITGSKARADGHVWRARACAILTGVGTVMQDDPQLTVRDVRTERQPLRVIVDRHGETPPHARVLADANVLVVTASTEHRARWPNTIETIALPDAQGRIDLVGLLRMLAARGINELHVEAGAKLNGALLATGLVDELLLYLAPAIIGDPARGMFEGPQALTQLSARTELEFVRIDPVGDDLRIIARVRSQRERRA